MHSDQTRRRFLAAALETGLAAAGSARSLAAAPAARQALIAITLNLEMSRNFPTWDQTHWDYEKGNLDAATKRYAVEARGGSRRGAASSTSSPWV